MSCLVDTDYLHITARIRSLERSLLSNARREHMLEARSDEEAQKVLQECGYGEISQSQQRDLERVLLIGYSRMLTSLEAAVPDRRLTDIFRLKYDYHNLKAILKSDALSQNAEQLMIDLGRVPLKVLVNALRLNDLKELPPVMRDAAEEARGVLSHSGDPQRSDVILDLAYFEEMRQIAAESQSRFLQGYVTLHIDITNMRIIVRTSRIGLGADFLRTALITGGKIDKGRLISIAVSGAPLYEHFTESLLEGAAAAGTLVVRGEIPLSEFERQADNTFVKYLKAAKFVAFGEQPLIAYIAAKENEIISIRTIMSGRKASISNELIRERLREAYV